MLTDHTALLVHLPPDPAMGYHGFVACETVVEGSVTLRRFSAAFCMGTAPGLGQQLGGAGREQRSVPADRWVYLPLSSQPWPPASSIFFLLPHGLKLSLSIMGAS